MTDLNKMNAEDKAIELFNKFYHFEGSNRFSIQESKALAQTVVRENIKTLDLVLMGVGNNVEILDLYEFYYKVQDDLEKF